MLFSEIHTIYIYIYIYNLWAEYRCFKCYHWWSVTLVFKRLKELNKFTVKIKIFISHEKWLLKSKHITEHENTTLLLKKKVKQSHNRSGQAQRVPGN